MSALKTPSILSIRYCRFISCLIVCGLHHLNPTRYSFPPIALSICKDSIKFCCASTVILNHFNCIYFASFPFQFACSSLSDLNLRLSWRCCIVLFKTSFNQSRFRQFNQTCFLRPSKPGTLQCALLIFKVFFAICSFRRLQFRSSNRIYFRFCIGVFINLLL